METIEISEGIHMPTLAFGTGTVLNNHQPGEVDRQKVELVKHAIRYGYRHLDTAEMYGTEQELGVAIKESGAPRSELFITTKVSSDPLNATKTLETSLAKLQLSYVDSYLIHAPYFAEGDAAKLQEAWRGMQAVHAAKKARSIGVSNYTVSDLQAIFDMPDLTVPPTVNQIEFSPYLQQKELRDYCKKKGVTLTAYGVLHPLTRNMAGPLDTVLDDLSTRLDVSKEGILMRWSMNLGVVVVTTSRQETRIANYKQQVGKAKLDKADEEEVSAAGKATAEGKDYVPRVIRYARSKGYAV